MAEFLNTKEIALGIQNIIQYAQAEIILVSPYIKADLQIKERLAVQAGNPKVRITLVYGDRIKLRSDEKSLFASLDSVAVRFRKVLHAKCYLNEQVALVTSMNLYNYSQVNNDEMGILVSRKDDRPLYDKVRSDVERIVNRSLVIREPSVAKPAAIRGSRLSPRPFPRNLNPGVGIPETGFCIRCQALVPAAPIKPYCDRHFVEWNKYGNADYQDTYCHICGDFRTTTLRKPLCPGCYRSYRDTFVFYYGDIFADAFS